MGMPSSLGEVLTDNYMLTLDRYDQDTAVPSRSNCLGACTAQWLPAIAGDKVTFAGGDKSLLGMITRPDGAKQLTLKGWPLYRFAGDRAEDDTKGHGVGGEWFAPPGPDSTTREMTARARHTPIVKTLETSMITWRARTHQVDYDSHRRLTDHIRQSQNTP